MFISSLSPHDAIVMNHLSRWNGRSFVVTRTLRGRHTFATVIQVCPFFTGASIHWRELDFAGDINLTESSAGGLTGLNVVMISPGFRTNLEFGLRREKGKKNLFISKIHVVIMTRNSYIQQVAMTLSVFFPHSLCLPPPSPTLSLREGGDSVNICIYKYLQTSKHVLQLPKWSS